MRRSTLIASLAPALGLLASCAADTPADDTSTANATDQSSDEGVEDSWEVREPESHTSAQARMVIADDDSGEVHVTDVHSGDVLDTFALEAPFELTPVDDEGSQVLLSEDAVLDTGIRWESHGGHLDPANVDPELVTAETEILDALEAAEDDPFDSAAVQSVEGSTLTARSPRGTDDETSVELPEEVAAAAWDPYWEQALALTVDGTLHTIDPESGSITTSETVTEEVSGTAAIAAAESHVYVSNAATETIVEVEVSREGLEADRVRALDFAPTDLLVVGMEPLDHDEHTDDEDDHDHDDHDH